MQRPSILQLEQAFLGAWPAHEEVADGGWLWRFAHGYTKRANSAQSMDPGDENEVEQRLERYSAWAAERGVDPTYRVTPLTGERVLAALNRLGWKPFEQSLVMAMPVGGAFHPKHDCQSLPVAAEWCDLQSQMSGYGPDTVGALRALLGRIKVPVTGLLVRDPSGVPAAAALNVNNQGIAVYLNVVVREDLRGLGYGRSAMHAALNWSRDAGAHWAAIQVVADNVPAVNLYRGLGFEEIYRYDYRRQS